MIRYEKVTNHDVERLREICGKDAVLWQDEISPDYSHDELSLERFVPELVVLPQSAQEVAEIWATVMRATFPSPPGVPVLVCVEVRWPFMAVLFW